MSTETIATRTFERVLPNGRFVKAAAVLHRIGSNPRPNFSLTGDEWASRRSFNSGSESGLLSSGCIHETLVAAFPELAGFARMHLSDDEGVPMHAVENGWYYYSGDAHAYELARPVWYPAPVDAPHDRAARRLRVDPAELPEGMDEAGFLAYVESLRPRWQAEADEARAFLAEVPS